MLLNEELRVLVVDDTVIYRKIVSDVMKEIPGVEVVGVASNGKIALARLEVLKPDLITLDIEMPEMNGIEVLEQIQHHYPDTGVIMLSTLTQRGSEMTMKALELGAFDFLPKPQEGSMDENRKFLKETLIPMLNAFKQRQRIKNILRRKPDYLRPSEKKAPIFISHTFNKAPINLKKHKSEIVAIGISTGGPNALSKVIPKFPEDLKVPILIVQHMPPVFTASLAQSLNAKSSIKVKEATDGELIKPGTAYIAPGGKQMKIAAAGDGVNRVIRITDDAPENSCKPSVDYLFRSVAHHYVGRATGVIMTGMGSDGTKSLQLMKNNGATIIAQDEASCVVYGMPKEPVESGLADVVVSLENIADEICKTLL